MTPDHHHGHLLKCLLNRKIFFVRKLQAVPMFIGKVHQLTHELLGQRMLNYFESGSIIVWLTSSFTGLVSTYQVNTYVANVYAVSFLKI